MKKENNHCFEINKDLDPLGILKATREVVLKATDVSINPERIERVEKPIKSCVEKKQLLSQEQFGVIDQTERGVQLVFLQDSVNFSFWPDKGRPKWQVKEGGKTVDGWYALVACFKRALEKGLPILDVEYLQNAPEATWQDFFQGENESQIPLLKERIKNLREAGAVLSQKYDGHFKNVIEASNFNCVELVRLLIKDFPSFRDIAFYNGKAVPFLKRAQITAYDLTLMFEGKNWGNLTNIDKLTAFADYKLPQILRGFGVLDYSNQLAQKIDEQEELPSGGNKEIEIRGATIWAVELLRRRLQTTTSPQIDNALWYLSQNEKLTPYHYHRTRSIFY